MTAIAADQSPSPLKTFTVTSEEGQFDEGPLAALVGERYRTEHQEIPLTAHLIDLLPRVVRAYDEPFADPSAIPTFAVAEAAGRQLKVVLNGEGADELFGGYRRSLAAWKLRRLSGPFAAAAGVSRIASLLPAPTGFRTPYSFLHRVARGLGQSSFDRYLVWSTDGFTEDEKQTLYGARREVPSTAKALAASVNGLEDRDSVDRFMAIDFALSLGDCLLVKMDIATMAHSLEARSPFLDHRLVDWVAMMPRRLLFSGRGTKPLLRRLALRYLPEAIVTAPKRGFEIPLITWVSGPLLPMISDLCLSRNGLLAEIFQRRQLERLIRHESGLDRVRWARRMWTLLMLAAWDEMCRPAA